MKFVRNQTVKKGLNYIIILGIELLQHADSWTGEKKKKFIFYSNFQELFFYLVSFGLGRTLRKQ